MIRTLSSAVVLSVACSTAALAAYTIPAGNYVVTTEIQNIQNDSTGICGSILKVGEVQVGEGASGGLGKTTQVVTPVPGTASPYTLGNQICNYSKLPATLNSSGTTPITGTVSCNLNGTTYKLTTTSGNGNIVNVAGTANNAYYLNATSSVAVGGTTLCQITTSTLNIYTGPKHP